MSLRYPEAHVKDLAAALEPFAQLRASLPKGTPLDFVLYQAPDGTKITANDVVVAETYLNAFKEDWEAENGEDQES